MIRRARRFVLALFTVATAWAGLAAAASVAIVLSENSAPYEETASSVQAAMERGGARASVTVYHSAIRTADVVRAKPDVIVAVGVRAAQDVASQSLAIPMVTTLIPHQAFEKIARSRDRKYLSAVFLDQPLVRQMELIRLALPERNKIGLLLGPESQESLKSLQAAAKEARLGVAVEQISAADELLPALQRVLADGDVLLAVPDSMVFNRGTVQSLLLTSYRYQDPVIGFSLAYVKAGALAAVYSTPEQVGRQAGEMVVRVLAGKSPPLPPPEYPKYFSVSVNVQVARSLGLKIADETSLYQKLKAASESE